MTVDALVDWLTTLKAPGLAALLRRRDDVLEAAPADLTELADALLAPSSLRLLLRRLNRPQLQVLDALAALPSGTSVGRLAELVGRAPDDPTVAAVLDDLVGRAAVVRDGELLWAPDELRTVFPHPLRLGSPAVDLLSGEQAAMVKQIAANQGLGVQPSKAAAVSALVGWFDDAEAVRRTVAALSPATREMLDQLAWRGPILTVTGGYGLFGHQLPDEIDWAARFGLLIRRGPWGNEFEMPAEVGLAMRGADWHAPFDPEPPAIATVPIGPQQIERPAAAAATAVLDHVTAILAECAANPLTLRKAGGVTSRDLKRLAKRLGLEIGPLVFLLQLCAAAHLVAGEETNLLVTDKYDEWLASEPSQRLAAILRAWWAAPVSPMYQPGPEAPSVPDLQLTGGGPRRLRGELFATLAAVTPDRVPAPADAFAATAWRSPLAILATADPLGLAEATLAEAELLGASASGAATPIGRALVSAPDGEPALPDPLTEALSALLPAAATVAIYQADLTVMVAGVPTAELAALLDAAAVRESRGHATTWRFTAGTVRSALDNGWDADGLVGALAGFARDGELPQALRYLIADVGRQHGRIAVRAFGCVLMVADEALAAELQAATALRKLGLAPLAPGVVGAAAPIHRVLELLRANGYAPVEQDDRGQVLIDRAPARRAASSDIVDRLARSLPSHRRPSAESVADRRSAADPLSVAKALVKAGVPKPARPARVEMLPANVIQLSSMLSRVAAGSGGGPGRALHEVDDDYIHLEMATPKLAPNERRLLWKALADGIPVRVTYQDANGTRTNRIIEPTELLGRVLVAYCHLRQDERNFALDRISSVRLG